ncbi:hypothetical protein HS088_TW13G00433 [Tripterygium wilfordii]|uniref:NPH3 domain-containing protein n=1 Tax=Tripterygium wilfordii TaxID=458696 RepID=A0A7J7CU78_TRIWF|nr:hypothetical protein HS088_TW13G00433 [Tripterygium wilfordii]
MVANPQSQMACMTLGSKSEAFHREGKTWLCTAGLPSDVMIEIGEMSFNVHKMASAPASAPALWNGLSAATKPPSTTDHWWFEDVSFLRLAFYKRLILAIESRGMEPETIAASLLYYAKRYLPLMNMQATYDINPNPNGSKELPRNDEANKMEHAQDYAVAFNITERVSDLEKECLSMNQELRKLAKSKRSWRIFSKKLGFGQKSRHCNAKESKSCDMKNPASSLNGKQDHQNAEVLC